jgi:hypothetical protein
MVGVELVDAADDQQNADLGAEICTCRVWMGFRDPAVDDG